MINRRRVLAGAAAAGFLAGCTANPTEQEFVSADGPQVKAAEQARPVTRTVPGRIEAARAEVDLGGKIVSAWCYGGQIPGPPLRVTAGERMAITVANRLPAETSIHWHGLALRNDADGVPHLTQAPIASGSDYRYEFTASQPGTYWFHPHTGTQLERGLYTPLIIDDPREPLAYDGEWIVVLDDWPTSDPDTILGELRKGMMHGGGDMMAASILLGGDAGDVAYPHYLLNGKLPADPQVYQAKPGMKVRIRFINAGADTAFRVTVGGHQMTLTHTDGFPVAPIQADALLIGMGERYDVLVTLGDGVFPLVALAEGKNAAAFALIRTGGGQAPPATVRPAELDRRIVSYRQLSPAPAVALARKDVDRTIRLELTGAMMSYDWAFNRAPFDHTQPLRHAVAVSAGERVKIEFVNTTTMFHPVHLHGHTFATGTEAGPRKDTAIVLPGQTLPVYFDADNPGRWMIHCHNVYHAEAGMMTVLGYRKG